MFFSFPNSASEFLILTVPLITLVLGACFLLMPRPIFRFMGLEPELAFPHAVGEGRSSFAGAMIATGLGCLLLQDPIALQPGLNFILAGAWSIAAMGRILQIVFDGGWRKRIQVRLILALGLAVAAWSVTEIPYFSCRNPFSNECALPQFWQQWFLFALAAATVITGLAALLKPKLALKIMRLQSRINTPFAVGEPRGTFAGFHIAIGSTYLLTPQPVDFVALVLGGAWLFTGIGRFVSIVLDRGWTRLNVLTAVFQIGAGAATIAIVLRII